MTKKLLFVTTILLVIVATVFAADAITGKWTYEMPMGRGGMGGGGGAGAAPGGAAPGGAAMPPRIVTLDLKADGATLTGTILQPAFGGNRGGGGGAAPAAPATQPAPTPISKGTVNGNKITFEVTVDRGNGPTTSTYEGTVSGAELQLKITRQGPNGPTTTDVVAKHPAS
jgi:hypothetical protein